MTADLLYLDGKPIALSKKVGSGGEADIFLLKDDNSKAAKIYKVPLEERAEKLPVMISLGLAERFPLITFPQQAITDRKGSLRGFTMRFVPGAEVLHQLYSISGRKRLFPNADYRFLVRSSANIAKAVAQVHSAGAVIGDINHSGILISEKAIATLIDADSFQISTDSRVFSCKVGTPDYTPPELQGTKLSLVTRNSNHDAFGLAIIIFQLLFMGRHPFNGVYKGDMPTEKAIAEHRFAYSKLRNVSMTPPPGASTLDDLPSFMSDAFERSFNNLGSPRTSALEWVNLLEKFEKTLIKCSNNSVHFYSHAAKSCPWCSMENLIGVTLFVMPRLKFGVESVSRNFNIEELWKRVDALQIPAPGKIFPRISNYSDISASIEATSFSKKSPFDILLTFVSIAAGIVLTAVLPAIWFITLGGGAYLAHYFYTRENDASSFEHEYYKAKKAWSLDLKAWQDSLGVQHVISTRLKLEDHKRDYIAIDKERKIRLAEIEKNRLSSQLEDFLDRFQISRANLSGVGPSKVAVLMSWGIETAADVNAKAILAVPGFGKVTTKLLIDWRNSIEKKFQLSSTLSPSEQVAIANTESELQKKRMGLEIELKNCFEELDRAYSAVQVNFSAFSKNIDLTFKKYAQASIDWKTVGGNPEDLTTWYQNSGKIFYLSNEDLQHQRPPERVHSKSTSSYRAVAASSAVPNCPNCGTRMVLRSARRGPGAGRQFWGCSRYPKCRGTRSI